MHSEPAASTAAPGSAQDARTRPDTNHTAPVASGSRAAVEPAGSERTPPRRANRRAAHTQNTGGPVSDAGIAGMAGPAGTGRPEISRQVQMSSHSAIEWTDATWNPVTGCNKVSPGCKHCYAQTFSERFRGVPGHPFEQGFDLRLWPERIELPLRWRTPRRIFVNSMSDLFHEKIPAQFIDSVFETMRAAHWHQFQVLTKRPDRMSRHLKVLAKRLGPLAESHPNVWVGTSVETQRYVFRAGIVAAIPAAVRFLSCEPLLGPLDLDGTLGPDRINWVIVGRESGPRARPMDQAWVRTIRDQCRQAAVPFFFKQWGGVRKHVTGRTLDRRTWNEMPQAVAP